MKKIGLYSILAVLVLALLGCACGQKAATGPENPNFTVVIDDAETATRAPDTYSGFGNRRR